MDIYQKTTAFYRRVKTEKKIFGKSRLGRNLYAVKVGEGSPVGIAVYAVHGREFITAELAFRHYEKGAVGALWLIPLLNPDGALISEVGLSSVRTGRYRKFLSSFSAEQLRLWKANAYGVDLNVNFDADFGQGVKNVRTRGVENCVGPYPFSERETRAIRAFTLSLSPDYTVSYHTKGEEIYWYYGQPLFNVARDLALAETLASSCGYPLKAVKGSVGGYKDWCIKALGIPSFTVEVGNDSLPHPLCGEEALSDVLTKNENALCALSKAVKELKGIQ
ncbi:MAG: hypothetical protein IJX81_06945 [Clostridia bacterium]|nr:hypothetical protein [Clostridia bacterium]